ncbi:hypothetical protein ONZ45_g17889 [Pleurotus djamor]|nr:hypothetical protein ONZ45_g17889 [Pleurotus djamor]
MELTDYHVLGMPIAMRRGGIFPSRNLPRFLITLLCVAVWSIILANIDTSDFNWIAEEYPWSLAGVSFVLAACIVGRLIFSAERLANSFKQWHLISRSILNFASLANTPYHCEDIWSSGILPQEGVFGTLEEFVIALGLYAQPKLPAGLNADKHDTDTEDVVSDTLVSKTSSFINQFLSLKNPIFLSNKTNTNRDASRLWVDLHLEVLEMERTSEIDEPTADDIKSQLALIAHFSWFSFGPRSINLSLPLDIVTVLYCLTLVGNPLRTTPLPARS